MIYCLGRRLLSQLPYNPEETYVGIPKPLSKLHVVMVVILNPSSQRELRLMGFWSSLANMSS